MTKSPSPSIDLPSQVLSSTPSGIGGTPAPARRFDADPEVPLLDLTPIHQPIRNELYNAVISVLESNRFIGGPEVEAFEREIAAYCHVEHAVGLSSGTDALLVSLMALEIGPGDEVIVPSFTFFSTAGSVHRLGAKVIFCDIDPISFNIDPDHIRALVTPRTKAVIAVDLFGQCAAMDRIRQVCDPHGLKIVEDAAQSIGARYNGAMAGGLGHVGCFSFFPSKNLGGIGDGGAVTTNDGLLAEKIRNLRNHGETVRYHHSLVGGNFRLDSIQAAALRVKLLRLEEWHEQRRQNAQQYIAAFSDLEKKGLVTLPTQLPNRKHVYNQFVIRVAQRDALQRYLASNRIGTAIYYPVPLHLQVCFAELGYREGSLPRSEEASREVLALPIYPGLSQDQLGKVIRSVRQFLLKEDSGP